MSTVNPDSAHDGAIVMSKTGRVRIAYNKDPDKDGRLKLHKVPDVALGGAKLTAQVTNTSYPITMACTVSFEYEGNTYNFSFTVSGSNYTFSTTNAGITISSTGITADYYYQYRLSGNLQISLPSPAITKSGSVYISISPSAQDLTGTVNLTNLTNTVDKLCNCPSCFNTFEEICVESAGACVPSDQDNFWFCRKGDSFPYQLQEESGGWTEGSGYGSSGMSYFRHSRPQLYTAEEVKAYYPNWRTLVSQYGWDENSELWLVFVGKFYKTQVCVEWDEYHYCIKYADVDTWCGPPTKEQPVPIDYEIHRAVDFTQSSDIQGVNLWAIDDISDCHGYTYVLQYGEYACSDCNQNYGNCIVRHPATSCNTGNCLCSFSKGQFKQWKKDNNREHEWYLISVTMNSSAYSCTGAGGGTDAGNSTLGGPSLQFTTLYRHALNYNVSVNGSNVLIDASTLLITFSSFNSPYRYLDSSYGNNCVETTSSYAMSNTVIAIDDVLFTGIPTQSGAGVGMIWTQAIHATGTLTSTESITGNITVEILENNQVKVTLEFTMPCRSCNNGRGTLYKHEEVFTKGTYLYRSSTYACADCTGGIVSGPQYNICYRPAKRISAGLRTECQTWTDREWYTSGSSTYYDTERRCRNPDSTQIKKEQLYLCCDVPPSPVGYYFYATGFSCQTRTDAGSSGGGGIYNGQRGWSYMFASQTCSSGNQSNSYFTMAVAFSNHTYQTASVGANIQFSSFTEGTSGSPPTYEYANGGSVQNENYWTLCCNRIYWRLKVTANPIEWVQWPMIGDLNLNSARPGYPYDLPAYWWGFPESIHIEMWITRPFEKENVGSGYKTPEPEDYKKVIDIIEPVQYGSNGCVWDRINGECIGSCKEPSGYGAQRYCGPFSITGGHSSPGSGGSDDYCMSVSYGNRCIISRSTDASVDPLTMRDASPSGTYTYYSCSASGPPRRYCNVNSSMRDIDKPACYYQDCLGGFNSGGSGDPPSPSPAPFFIPMSALSTFENNGVAISGNVTTEEPDTEQYRAWKQRRQELIEQHPELADVQHNPSHLPELHGGFCKWSVIDEETRICGTCQHPYIRCTNSNVSGRNQYGFMPRLCGESKCIYFERK